MMRIGIRGFGWRAENWEAILWLTGWRHLSLGFHLYLGGNIELHLPFCFIRAGRREPLDTSLFERPIITVRWPQKIGLKEAIRRIEQSGLDVFVIRENRRKT